MNLNIKYNTYIHNTYIHTHRYGITRYIFTYVFMYVYNYICMYIYIYIYKIHTYKCIYECKNLQTHTQIAICMVHLHNEYGYALKMFAR